MSTQDSLIFPYQRVGAEWLASRRFALLADEMGLGKTAQVVLASDILQLKSILVVCPAIARINWSREFRRWSIRHTNIQVLSTLSDFTFADANIVICSFEYASAKTAELAKLKWDLIVLDEAHYLKSPNAKRSRHIFGKEGVVRACERVWSLTGTPAPNHAAELWITLYSFGVTPLTYDQFVEKFCDTVFTGYGVKIVGTKKSAIPMLRRLLSKVMLRRTVQEVLPELPPLFIREPETVEAGSVEGLGIDLTEELKERLALEEATVRETLEDPMLMTDDESLRALEGLAASVSTLRRYLGMQKILPAADWIVNALEQDPELRVVVFAIHKDVVKGLANTLDTRGYPCITVTGETPSSQRQLFVDCFQAPGNTKYRVFIGNIQAAGTNLTLTAASHVLFVERDWVPGNNAQASRRCRRIGQKKPVVVSSLVLDHPIDDRITRALIKKEKELIAVFSADKPTLPVIEI